MTRRNNDFVLIVAASLSALALTGCTSEKKPAPTSTETKVSADGASSSRVVNVEPGVAGGTVDDTTTVAVTVAGVNAATREVTLADDAGNKETYVASPEIRNFDQVHAGDKLTATLNERLVAYVRSDRGGDEASDTYAAALSRAPKGAKPGGSILQSYQVVADVTAIDAPAHTATLKFADGTTRPFLIRPDVDPFRYKVGDQVVIRVTSSLSLLTARP